LGEGTYGVVYKA